MLCIYLYTCITNVRVSQALTKNANLIWTITKALKAGPQMGCPEGPVLAQQRGDRAFLPEEEEKVGRGRGSPRAGTASQSCPLLLCRHWEATCSLPAFFKFLSQRGCRGGGIVKSSPPCHECARSSGAGGQKLFAISSGRDLCFDHGRGGLQSIKPSPGLRQGRGKGLPSASGGGCLSKGHKDTHLPLGFGREAEGMPSCSLSWGFKLPMGDSARETTVCATQYASAREI